MDAPALRVAAWLCLPLALGCSASLQADGSAAADTESLSVDGELGADAEQPSEGEQLSDPAATSLVTMTEDDPTASNATQSAMLGARHDLKLAAHVTRPRCACLAAAAGSPSDADFDWLGDPPVIDPATQIVVSFNSRGIPCAGEPEGSLGASYWGYRRKGKDVVVLLEAARSGRPITTGAILPKPPAGGRLVFEAIAKELPYGRPLDAGTDRCSLPTDGSTGR